MEHGKNENEIILIAVQLPMWECLQRPTPHLVLKNLHRRWLIRRRLDCYLYRGLELSSQLPIGLAVVLLLSPNILPRRS
jgi:hypothetical protein